MVLCFCYRPGYESVQSSRGSHPPPSSSSTLPPPSLAERHGTDSPAGGHSPITRTHSAHGGHSPVTRVPSTQAGHSPVTRARSTQGTPTQEQLTTSQVGGRGKLCFPYLHALPSPILAAPTLTPPHTTGEREQRRGWTTHDPHLTQHPSAGSHSPSNVHEQKHPPP